MKFSADDRDRPPVTLPERYFKNKELLWERSATRSDVPGDAVSSQTHLSEKPGGEEPGARDPRSSCKGKINSGKQESKPSDTLHRKSEAGKAAEVPPLVSAADLRAKLAGTPFEDVTIHDSPNELQNQDLRRYMERSGNLGAKGVFSDRPTVFAGNHDSIEDAIKSVIHEVGHEGLEALRQRTRSMGPEVGGSVCRAR